METATMTNLFHPRTFSTDWEVMVLDRLERCVSNDKLMAFAGALRQETGLPVDTDWNSLEFAVGINESLGQIWERIRRVTVLPISIGRGARPSYPHRGGKRAENLLSRARKTRGSGRRGTGRCHH